MLVWGFEWWLRLVPPGDMVIERVESDGVLGLVGVDCRW